MTIAICTSAFPGSGQDEVADRIVERYEVKKYSIGDIFRRIAKERDEPATREYLRKIREECDKKHGGDRRYLPVKLSEEILAEGQIPVITGVRTKEELEVFRENFDKVYLVFVYAEKNIRFERLKKRGDERDPRTFEDFLDQLEKERKMFDLDYLKRNRDYCVPCNMSLDNLKENADSILSVLDFLDRIPKRDTIK